MNVIFKDLQGNTIHPCDKCGWIHPDEFVLKNNDEIGTRRIEECDDGSNDLTKILEPLDKSKLPRYNG